MLGINSKLPLLEIHDLRTYFFTSRGVVRSVDGVSITIQEKEAVGLIGESGCGKTVTGLSITRLIPQPPGRTVGGSIRFCGKELLDMPEKEIREIRGGQIAMIFQDPLTFLNPVTRISDQIGEAIILHKRLSGHHLEREILRMLDLVGVPHPARVAESYPHQLSGGMRQRVLIAIAISCNPALLIADEPTTALDITIQLQILTLIKELIQTLDTSLLLISHDLGVISYICDRVYVMYAAKIVEEAPVQELFKEPLHPYSTGLLRSVTALEQKPEILPTIEGIVPDLVSPPDACRFHPRCTEAADICRQKEPELKNLGSGRRVACWMRN